MINQSVASVFKEFISANEAATDIISIRNSSSFNTPFIKVVSIDKFAALIKNIDETNVKVSTGKIRLLHLLEKETIRLYTVFGKLTIDDVIFNLANGTYALTKDLLPNKDAEEHVKRVEERLKDYPYLLPYCLTELVKVVKE